MEFKTNWKDMPPEQFAQEVDELLWVMDRVTIEQLQAGRFVAAAQAAGWNPWDTVQFIRRTDGLL